MAGKNGTSRVGKIIRNIVVGLVFLVAVVLLLMWLAGFFHPKIDTRGPEVTAEAAARPVPDDPSRLVAARTIQVPRIESAVGSIRAVHETAVASKLLAKVVEVRVTAGQKVTKGEVLVKLDDADLRARLQQAVAAADGAEAARDQAKIEYDRISGLIQQGSATQIEMDRVQTALKSAEAELARAREAVSEAETILSYATIKSPIDGTVIDKKVEAGDTVSPGQVLVTLYDPDRMQLVASVRESLTRRLEVGESIGVRIDALDKICDGVISEIVPEAETASRTFSVKVTGPCPAGVYSGMFGRLLIPLEKEPVLVIPRSTVRRVGQLDVVEVADGGVLRRRAVQLGRQFGQDVEVLSGLRQGERVLLPAS